MDFWGFFLNSWRCGRLWLYVKLPHTLRYVWRWQLWYTRLQWQAYRKAYIPARWQRVFTIDILTLHCPPCSLVSQIVSSSSTRTTPVNDPNISDWIFSPGASLRNSILLLVLNLWKINKYQVCSFNFFIVVQGIYYFVMHLSHLQMFKGETQYQTQSILH